jgi:class 3 adenylate cyclase/tetratricopeptide (TPR) repeat protein
LSERLQRHGRPGAEELVGLISATFAGLIGISDHYGGDVLKFRGDALLILYSDGGHAARAYEATKRMQALIGETGQMMSSIGPITLRMSSGIYNGPCQFFLIDALHRELVVTGPAATETIRLESEANVGQILLSGAVPQGEPEPYDPPPREDGDDLKLFIPPPLRAQLLLEAGEGEHRLVTVAFLKFGGVGELLAQDGLEGVLGELSSLAALVDDTCAELGVAWLDSDIDADGGRFYVVGGAPTTTGEDEERLLQVMRRVVLEHEGDLALQAGISRGAAFCGDVGTLSRRTYTVMGDAVNLAARLTARAEAGGILVTGDVLDRARTGYESRPQPLLLKGKAHAITAYHVGSAVGFRSAETGTELPLVGRDAELAVLDEALGKARMRQQQLVELVGEPGIGKTRLVEELKRQALGFTQLGARCDPYAASRPYFALRALMRPLAGITPDLDETSAGAQLVAWVRAVMPDLAPWLPLLAIPFGAKVSPTPQTEEIDAAFRRDRLLDAVEQFLSRVLMMPTLLVIEDVHWADEASLDLLRHLVRHSAPRPWLVCITRRPEGARIAGDVQGHVQLELARLTTSAAQSLALGIAGDVSLSTEALEAIRERSGGNPLFIRELMNATHRGGGIDALPETVETVITSRIDTLSPEDRFLLRNAAVLGARFHLDLLEEVLQGELDDVDDHARWERLREFVAWEGARELGFVHDLLRTVAYEGMSFRRRGLVHGRVGDALERRGAEPALLSLHFLEGGRYSQAWEYATAAAGRARAEYANVVAAELYGRALEAAEHLELAPTQVADVSEALGDVAFLFADFEKAGASYLQARTLGGDSARLLLKEGQVRERRGLYDEALEWVERAASAADDNRTRIEVEILEAGILYRQGRFEESIEVGRRAVSQAEATAERAALAHASYVLDGALTQVGRIDEALTQQNLDLCEEVGDLRGLGATLINLGIHAYYAGRWSDALDFYHRSAQVKERMGDVEGSAMIVHNEAEILCDQGRFDEAEKLFREALRVARASGHRLIESFVTANLGRLAARTSRFEEAHELLDAAAEQLSAIGSRGLALETDVRRAECFVLEGRHRDALDVAEGALARAGEGGQLDVVGPALERTLGYALFQTRRPDEALPHFERSLELARISKANYEIALTLKALADTYGGESAEAEEIFARLGVIATPHVPLP